MAIRTFQVGTYQVTAGQIRSDPFGAWRHLHLLANPQAGGGTRLASLFFFVGPSYLPLGLSPGWLGKVVNVGQPSPAQEEIYAHLLKDDWDQWWDILREEGPVTVQYVYEDLPANPPDPSHRLGSIFLTTGPEPVGEGEDDLRPWPFLP